MSELSLCVRYTLYFVAKGTRSRKAKFFTETVHKPPYNLLSIFFCVVTNSVKTTRVLGVSANMVFCSTYPLYDY